MFSKRISEKILYFILIICFISCSTFRNGEGLERTKSEITKLIGNSPGTYAVAYKDLQNGNTIFINETESFHAASTMKTPVMIEVYKQAGEGKFSMKDSVVLKKEFKSIIDGSVFSLLQFEDGDSELYKNLGRKTSIYNLIYRMIILSSNIATNMLIEIVGAENVTNTIRSIGANRIQIIRGVEDDKAFKAGKNNTTTAHDLLMIFESIANGSILSKENCDDMIKILLDQKLNDKFPAYLPKEVRIAHKTGSFETVEHDSGIFFLPDGRKYVLVCLSKNLPDNKTGKNTISQISKIIYQQLYTAK